MLVPQVASPVRRAEMLKQGSKSNCPGFVINLWLSPKTAASSTARELGSRITGRPPLRDLPATRQWLLSIRR